MVVELVDVAKCSEENEKTMRPTRKAVMACGDLLSVDCRRRRICRRPGRSTWGKYPFLLMVQVDPVVLWLPANHPRQADPMGPLDLVDLEHRAYHLLPGVQVGRQVPVVLGDLVDLDRLVLPECWGQVSLRFP
ncbi:hypothetical protein M514_04755 [Trichuris suis]|uniref:Uncharacterized protein n=1 Tax=Trichuris suis TaxID=68888 RepID=A0A085MB16_9BILA|nr:hypothetical protein M513_04755 [Trichuris suis]KFD61685.1 hypothetical protein M514_04755 [Trichuris suis]